MSDVSRYFNDFLLNECIHPIRDPLWGHVYFPESFLKIIQTPEYQQLGRIKQLGPSYLVYPGATHSRLNHSLGVFHIASRMVKRMSQSTLPLPLTLQGAKAFLAAALLHDLGHFPYTHSLKELPLDEHEQLTSRLILDSSITGILKNDAGIDPAMVAAIVDETMPNRSREVSFFRKILSGPIDPDKLDYLNRDAYFCGVPYGSQDVDYILSVLQPHPEHGFTITQNGVSTIEGLLFSKYLMYRAVYWHPTVRTATGMIKKALHRGLEKKSIRISELYGLDDDSFYRSFAENQGEEFSLIRKVYNRDLFKTIGTWSVDPENPQHTYLDDLTHRSIQEELIRSELSELLDLHVDDFQILLDIPENISFESKLMIDRDSEIISYHDAQTVFTQEVVHQFTRNLRKIRLAVAPSVKERIREKNIPTDSLLSLGGLQ